MSQAGPLAALLRNAGCVEEFHAAGAVIFAEGSIGDQAYLVVEGTVHAVRRGPAGDQLVGVVEAGQLFGESAFLQATARLAATIASTDCRVIVIPGARLPEILAATPEVAMELVRVFSARLRIANARTRQVQAATALSQRLVAGLESDLTRLAGELADGPRRTLAGCQRAVETASQLAETNPARAAAELDRLEELAAGLGASLDVMVDVLGRHGAETGGTVRFLRRRLTVVQADGGVRIRLDWPQALRGRMEPVVEDAIFDLVDGVVASALTRARARTIEVDVRHADGRSSVVVAHEVPPESASAELLGDLDALRDRVLLLEGSMRVAGRDGGGTRITFELPSTLKEAAR